jgi:hypothetical protein
MSLHINNDTHWRTSDIKRIIQLALSEADADPGEDRKATIRYQKKGKGSRVSYVYYQVNGTKPGDPGALCVYLPKRGPKDTHPNAMVALAASRDMATAGVDQDAVVLAVSDTYFLANAFAFEFAKEAVLLYEDSDGSMANKVSVLAQSRRSINAPSWCSSDKLFVCKYKDPRKDGTYLAFVKKKETAIKAATSRIENLEAEMASLKKKLTSARATKRRAEKALSAAKQRRS